MTIVEILLISASRVVLWHLDVIVGFKFISGVSV